MELITARVFDNPIDANMLKSKLESEGINCFLFDESTVTLDPLLSNAVGGIKLKINKADTERVKELLNQIEGNPYMDDNNKVITCPNCNSSNIITGFKSFKGIAGIFSLLLSLLMMIYPFHFNNVYKCKNCNSEFKNN